MTASLASWTSLGTLSWRTTCVVLVGPHRIQSCWPLIPLLTQCSGVSLFMTRRRRPTRGPLSSVARRRHHPRSLLRSSVHVGALYCACLCLMSVFAMVSLVWVILFCRGFCCHCSDLWRMFCFYRCGLWVSSPTDTWPLLISSLANALSLMSRWCFPWQMLCHQVHFGFFSRGCFAIVIVGS